MEDQEHILAQLISLAKDSRADAVVIAGDIYDRAIPPAEAVKLLDWALSELIRGAGCPVFLISGNHDSADRLGFGAKLLSPGTLRIVSHEDSILEPMILGDEHGEVAFYGIPYFEPAVLRVRSEDATLRDHEAAMRWCLAKIHSAREPGRAAVAVAHAYVGGGAESQSERPLDIGGAYAVPASLFDGFAYTALGHLHRPQNPGKRIRYCGSLLPYHFEEGDHPKSVSLVELGRDRVPKIEEIRLKPKRKLRVISGRFADILARAIDDSDRDDFILVRREFDGPVLDPIGQLRAHYPNILGLETIAPAAPSVSSGPTRAEVRRAVNLHELFSAFFRDVTGNPLDEAQAKRILDNLKGEA